jgi:hypothetical protein
MVRLEKERKKDNKMFMNQIKRRPRAVQLFIDQYSVREQKLNKHIIELNNDLNKQTMDKKKLNKKVEEFINNIYNEKVENDEIEQELSPIKNISDERQKLIEKMIKNMENETDENKDYILNLNEYEVNLKKGTYNNSNNLNDEENKLKNLALFKEFKEKIISKENQKTLIKLNKEEKNSKLNSQDTKNKSSTLLKLVSKNNLLQFDSNKIMNNLRRDSSNREEVVNKIGLLKRNTITATSKFFLYK